MTEIEIERIVRENEIMRAAMRRIADRDNHTIEDRSHSWDMCDHHAVFEIADAENFSTAWTTVWDFAQSVIEQVERGV